LRARGNGSTVPSRLQIHVNDFAVLIYSPPEIMLLAVDLHEYFVDEEGITVASMLSLKSFGISGAELDTPQPDGFVANCYAPFCKEIFNEWSGTPAVAEIESVVQPDRIADYIRRKSMAFICIHPRIVSQDELSWQYPYLPPNSTPKDGLY
jgi:hypothetical protein